MSWVWRYLGEDGQPFDKGAPPAPSFGAQGDAETWLGETWHELADAGVTAVTLLDDGREVYGPMSLETPGH
jgi:hypothetical protein